MSSDSPRKLSPPTEAAIIVTIAFGYFIFGSITSIFHPSAVRQFSNAHLIGLLVAEPLFAGVALLVLKSQGHLDSYGLTPAWKATAEGLALGVATYIVYAIFYLAVYSLFTFAPQPPVRGPVAPSLGLVIAISVVNPLFEEFFVSGYLITTLKRWKGPSVAINVSIAVRLLYHLYQGPFGVVSIIPIGFVFAYWYNRTGRLWPLVIAHALFDFAGLAAGWWVSS